jgi:hypothetical protein
MRQPLINPTTAVGTPMYNAARKMHAVPIRGMSASGDFAVVGFVIWVQEVWVFSQIAAIGISDVGVQGSEIWDLG